MTKPYFLNKIVFSTVKQFFCFSPLKYSARAWQEYCTVVTMTDFIRNAKSCEELVKSALNPADTFVAFPDDEMQVEVQEALQFIVENADEFFADWWFRLRSV